MNTLLPRFSRFPKILPQSRISLYKPIAQARFSFIRPLSTKMPSATCPTELLNDKLKALSLAEPLPKYPNCYPAINPVDVYRAHLTDILTKVTGVDASIVYPALQWTQTLEKGDLVLPVPALRLKGKKPDQLAAEWVAAVSWIQVAKAAANSPSSPNHLSSTHPPSPAHSSNSSSKSTSLPKF
jgi:hypothetical protein